ncbi:MAG: TonB-dependent receptor [Tannerella sp.]|jgi:TonB-linked SusC/RagA family outer membrane protein|nr:TonB-dependent receptor [Tannerella sp.]
MKVKKLLQCMIEKSRSIGSTMATFAVLFLFSVQVAASESEVQKNVETLQQTGRTVTGTVKDNSGEPIVGASVMVKGTTVGTVTDAGGRFSLNVPQDATLQVSYIGYQAREILVGNQSTIDVILIEDTRLLDEVVVIGYGTQRKTSLTTAITSVQTELLESRSLPKLSVALQGITPGVYIRQSSGRPNYATSTLEIRGASRETFSSNGALVLVDGIVGSIDEVSTNDIEQISVLKDAASAAIYGARATGGVVLITTKKGTSGKTTVTYNGTVGAQRSTLSNYKSRIVDSQTWMRANNEGRVNDGGNPVYTEEQIAQYNGSDPLKPARSQWFDWLNNNPLQQQHDLSVRGGTEKLNAYLSLGYVTQDGMVDNDDYKRLTFLSNVNWKPVNRLEISLSSFLSREDITRPVIDVPTSLRCLLNPPIDIFQYPNGVYNKGALDVGGLNAAQAFSEGGNNLHDYDRYRISADIRFELLEGLYVKYTIASNNTYNRNNSFTRMIDRYDSEGNYTGSATAGNAAYSTASEGWSAGQYLSNLVNLDYSLKIANHALTVMAGFQTESNRNDNISARGYRFINNELREISASIGSGTDLYGTSSADEWVMASMIGRATYAFKDRYLLELTARYDGSSRFSPSRRWGFFPGVSGGWRITEENFMKDVTWLSNLKLRASWGQLGNQGSNLYPFATSVSRGSWVFGDATSTTTSVGTPADPNLSWETKTTTNPGIEFGFLNNRLSGQFDWYYTRTTDIIATPTVPSTFGASAPVQNTYIIDNRGWEFELQWMDRIGDFTYSIGGNISNYNDEIVSLGGLGSTDPRYEGGRISLGSSTYYAEGRARNSLYLYQTEGLFVDQAEIDGYVKPSTLTRPGDIKFIDRNSDGQINSNDRYLSEKTTTAHYIYGFNLGAEWKGIDFSAVFNGVGSRWDFRNLDGHYTSGNRLTFVMFQSNYDNRWSPENPNKWADLPRLTDNNWLSGEFCTMFGSPSEYHLRNMKYIRLKNLQVGYTLPKGWTEKAGISKLRVYVTGENLFYYAPGYKEYIDPEAAITTQDSGAGSVYYGPSRVLSGGLSLTF